MGNQFREWLKEELKRRNLSGNKLAEKAVISQSVVSRVLTGEREATADFCVGVAKALGEAPEKILRMAGILPSTSESDPTVKEIDDILANMSSEQRKEMLRYARYLYQTGRDAE